MKNKLPWDLCENSCGESWYELTPEEAMAFRELCEMAADLNQENWTECWKLGMRLLCEIFEKDKIK